MNDSSRPRPIDPPIASQDCTVQCKKCNSCFARLPIASFGFLRYAKDGRRDTCKECRTQYFRLKRKAKYIVNSTVDDSVIRNVRIHNTSILNTCIFSTLEIRGFDTVSKSDYKIFFGPSKYTGMHSIALFDFNCKLYREFVYSGEVHTVLESVLDILRNLNIRLEYTDGDVVTSKSTIYYV